MNKTVKWLLRIAAVGLVIAGCALFLNKPIKNHFVKKTGENYDISTTTKKDLAKNKEKKGNFDFNSVEPITTKAVAQSQLDGSAENLPMIASIAVPSVSICLPIFNGLSNEGLLYGAGTMTADQEMGKGNYALASHRSDNPELLFTPLERLTTGDKIYLTDLTNVYTYEAKVIEKVPPEHTEVIDPVEGEKMVTLVTCGDLYAVTRLVVQGKLVDERPMKDISKEAAEAFKLPMKTY